MRLYFAGPDEELGDALERELPAQQPLYYAAPVGELAGQLSELADRALIEPKQYEKVLIALAGEERRHIVARYVSISSESDRDTQTSDRDTQASDLLGGIDARIDAFQIITAARWDRVLRFGACALSAAAGGLIAVGIHLGFAGIYAASVAGFALGGVTAWVVGDILAIIKRFAGG